MLIAKQNHMLVVVAKSAKLGQNEFSRFPLKEIFSGLSAFSALSGLVPNCGGILFLPHSMIPFSHILRS